MYTILPEGQEPSSLLDRSDLLSNWATRRVSLRQKGPGLQLCEEVSSDVMFLFIFSFVMLDWLGIVMPEMAKTYNNQHSVPPDKKGGRNEKWSNHIGKADECSNTFSKLC